MFWVLLIATLAAIGVGVVLAVDEESLGEILYCIGTSFISVFVIGCFAWGIISVWVDDNDNKTEVVKESFSISSINDQTNQEGSFFLGSGSVKGVTQYYYYVSDGENSYHLANTPTANTTIVEDGNAQLVEYKQTGPKQNFWFGFMKFTTDDTIKTEIHVPKDTIVKSFVLDAQN